jgi:hypothetical protein
VIFGLKIYHLATLIDWKKECSTYDLRAPSYIREISSQMTICTAAEVLPFFHERTGLLCHCFSCTLSSMYTHVHIYIPCRYVPHTNTKNVYIGTAFFLQGPVKLLPAGFCHTKLQHGSILEVKIIISPPDHQNLSLFQPT